VRGDTTCPRPAVENWFSRLASVACSGELYKLCRPARSVGSATASASPTSRF
jgi:hypothetical protein